MAIDLKDPEGREAFLALVRHGRRGGGELPARGGRPAAASASTPCCAVNPADHPLLDHRLRPERAPGGLGRPRHQLPGRGRLPGHHRAGGPTGARRYPAPPSPTPPGGGMQAAMAVMAALIGRGSDRPGRPPRRVHRRRRAVAHLAGRRRVPGHRGPGRARPQHHHRPVRLLRHLPGRRRRLAGGRGHRAQVLRQPLPAARVRAVGRPPTRRRGPGQDPGRLRRRVRHPGPRRLGGRAGRRRHLRHPGPVGGRAGRRRPVPPGAPSSRRYRSRRRRCGCGAAPRPGSVRSAPVLAGMVSPEGPVVAGDPSDRTPTRCWPPPGSIRPDRRAAGRRGWWHERHRDRRHRGPDRRRPRTRRRGSSPSSRGTSGRPARRWRTATRCSGTTGWPTR